jgi:nitrate reductase beta subunit
VAPSRELLAVLQLFRAGQKIIFRYEIEEGPLISEQTINGRPWQMYDDTVIGFDRNGTEVVRVGVQEPFHVRPEQHQNSI